MSETLYRKYRPKIFANVSEQAHVKEVLQNQLKSDTLTHAYLFSGPRGVGKTTIARLLAKAANCDNGKGGEPCLTCESCLEIERGATMDLFEIDAASHTGVDHVREMIIENVRFAPSRLKKKVFIIDEVHMLSTSAFNALLKTLEEPPAYALFILATTELHKVPETIVSRCQRFDFHRVPLASIVERLKGLVKAEKAKVAQDVLETIARKSEGCLRDAESLLGQVLAVDDPALVLPPSCAQESLQFLTHTTSGHAAEAIAVVDKAMERGVSMESLMDEILTQLRHALLKSLDYPAEALYESTIEKNLNELAHTLGAARLQELLRSCLGDRELFRLDQFPQLALEVFAAQYSLTTISNSSIPHPSTPDPQLSDATPLPKAQTKIKEPETGAKINTTIAQIKEKWMECCKSLESQSATLPLVLQNADVCALHGTQLHVKFPFQFHVHQINELKNKRLIEEALGKFFSEPLCIIANYAPADADAVVAELIQEFGGLPA